MIPLLPGHEATFFCNETDVALLPHSEATLSQYSYQAYMVFHAVKKEIPQVENIRIQGVVVSEGGTFTALLIRAVAGAVEGFLPSESASRILREAGFPTAVPPDPSS